MPRSLKKGPFVDEHLLKKVEKAINKEYPSPAASAAASAAA